MTHKHETADLGTLVHSTPRGINYYTGSQQGLDHVTPASYIMRCGRGAEIDTRCCAQLCFRLAAALQTIAAALL